MKAHADRADETIWAYLHGELDQDARADVEREIADDRTFRARLARARRLDGWIRSVAPHLAEGVSEDGADDLVDEALAAWEREHPGLAQAGRPASAAFGRPRARGYGLFRRPAFAFAGLAAAALLIVAVSPVLLGPPRPRWSEPVFVPLTVRGAASAQESSGTLDKAAARECQTALREALARVAERQGSRLPSGLTFTFRLQELRGGAFSVCVQARLRDGRTAGEWVGDFSSLAGYLGRVDSSAERIATELQAFSGVVGVGGRP